MMAWLGWFVRSETAHDHLHFHAPAKLSALTGALKQAGSHALAASTKTPRWLKVAPAPVDSRVPAGPHRHRDASFDSLAAGLWCGLFAPAVVPVPNLSALAATLRPLPAPPDRLEWLLLPGRAPPALA